MSRCSSEVTENYDEPKNDKNLSFPPSLTPSHGLIEFFLDNEYKKDDAGYRYCEVKCLDESDGQFKYYTNLCSNIVKPPQEDDSKNYCVQCDKQFYNLLAAQNHYIFTHPDSSFLTKPSKCKGAKSKKRNYDWLNQPILPKPVAKTETSSNIILLKDKEDRKLKLNKSYIKLDFDSNKCLEEELPDVNKLFTLENIKARPVEGIKVVKKSEINFNELRLRAKQKLLYDEDEIVLEKTPEEALEVKPQFVKVEIDQDVVEELEQNSYLYKAENSKALYKSKMKTVKYRCQQCCFEVIDPFVFDQHMKQHINTSYVCIFCTKEFCTKIGILKHTQLCNNTGEKVM